MSYISNGCNDCSTVDFGFNNQFPSQQINNQLSGNYLGSSQESVASPNPYLYSQPQQQQPQQQQPQQMMQQQPQQRQVAQPKQMPKLPVKSNTTDNQTGQTVQGTLTDYFGGNSFTLMFAFVVALAWHETIKYYINQAIKFGTGTPTYYIVYAVIATLASICLSSLRK